MGFFSLLTQYSQLADAKKSNATAARPWRFLLGELKLEELALKTPKR